MLRVNPALQRQRKLPALFSQRWLHGLLLHSLMSETTTSRTCRHSAKWRQRGIGLCMDHSKGIFKRSGYHGNQECMRLTGVSYGADEQSVSLRSLNILYTPASLSISWSAVSFLIKTGHGEWLDILIHWKDDSVCYAYWQALWAGWRLSSCKRGSTSLGLSPRNYQR